MHIPEGLGNTIGEFRNRLDDRIYHVEHDIDMDGFASGIITTVALRRLGFEAYPYVTERSKVFVPERGALVLTDIALNNEPTKVIDEAAKRGVNVYAIDHHPWTDGYLEKLHAAINPHYIQGVPEPSRWNTGFLAYLTFRDVTPEYGWLAAISVYTDYCIAPWSKPLVDRYGYENVKKAGDLLTAFIATVDDLTDLDYILLNEVNGLDDVLKDERFIDAYDTFDATVQKYSEDPRTHAILWDEDKKVMILQVSEHYRQINSVVSTVVSSQPQFRDWVVIVVAANPDEDGYVKASLRCQEWEKRMHMGELAQKLAEIFNGMGGGHPPAAGLRIPAEKMDELPRVIQSLL